MGGRSLVPGLHSGADEERPKGGGQACLEV